MTFQNLILALQKFWAERGCLIVQPYNSEVGAGTYNPATFLRALGPEPWNVAFVERASTDDDEITQAVMRAGAHGPKTSNLRAPCTSRTSF